MRSPELADLSARMAEVRARLTAAYYECNCNSQDPRVASLSQEFDRLCNDWIRLTKFDQIANAPLSRSTRRFTTSTSPLAPGP